MSDLVRLLHCITAVHMLDEAIVMTQSVGFECYIDEDSGLVEKGECS